MMTDTPSPLREMKPQAGRRGRPRRRAAPVGLVRRNLLVEPRALEQLRSLYGAASESEAVRRAIDLALLAHEGQELGEWLAARGGPVDAYGPPPPLPVYLSTEDHVAGADDDDPAG